MVPNCPYDKRQYFRYIWAILSLNGCIRKATKKDFNEGKGKGRAIKEKITFFLLWPLSSKGVKVFFAAFLKLFTRS